MDLAERKRKLMERRELLTAKVEEMNEAIPRMVGEVNSINGQLGLIHELDCEAADLARELDKKDKKKD